VNERFDRARVYRLFEQALGMDLADRSAYVRHECSRQPALQSEVEALLAAANQEGYSTGALIGGLPPVPDELIGRELAGRFRLAELIGQGGMGVVYRAERIDRVQQSVAIKLLGNELAAGARARFEREAQLLARLEHPAVARLIDFGVHDRRAWIALEFVRGRPIDAYCEDKESSIRERVRLLMLIADAVAAAHRTLVVHLDIKPGNVLVTDEGVPKLIDFGIAAALTDASATHMPTMARLFTPNFAAPEQVNGDPVTVATDVFGLGALGYRILTGRAPYAEAKTPSDYVLAVAQDDVEPPSQAAHSQPPEVVRALRGDLDAILLKSLERDPARRYASAADMRADLQNYLDDLPVTARVPALGYRVRKFVRRNRVPVGLAGLLGASLIAGGIVYGLQARGLAQARDMAARRGAFLEATLKSADPRLGRRDMTVAQLLDSSVKQVDVTLGKEPLVAASMLELVAETDSGLGRHAEGLSANTRAVALLRANDGSVNDLADALTTRGELLHQSGHTREAEAPLREAVSLLQGRRGEQKRLAAALDQLGVVLTNSAQEKEAEATYRSAINLYRSAGLAAQAAYPLDDLGVLLANEGRYAEASAAAQEAFDLQKRALPIDHPDLLNTEMNFASSLVSLHQFIRAEPLFRSVIAARQRVLGAEHRDTLMTQLELADDLWEQHRNSEAAEVAQRAAEVLERSVGPQHPWTLGAWGTYGASACRTDRASDGLAALKRVEQARIIVHGADEWHTISTRLAIGVCLLDMHRYADAEPLLLQAAAELERVRGVSFHRTQAAYQALHDLYAATGRPDEASRWGQKIIH
jgi:serine/threonine-protein kinase